MDYFVTVTGKVQAIPVPVPGMDGMFFAGTSGRIILRKDDKVFLFENNSQKILSEVPAPQVKRVVWNEDCSLVAFMSKTCITICDKQLNFKCQLNEPVKIKGGAFDENNIFVRPHTWWRHCAN